MITSSELNIANTSYTNKDFQSIYSEILELAQKISNRWNPDQSNESDPGITILKLMAFIADKNNYNIDKNILEAFMPSATQTSSMRKLCEMNGYNMKYYNSASTNVKFMYTGSSSDELTSSFTMTLPAFTTTITNEDGDITYTLVQDCILSAKNSAQSVTCVEGTIQDLSVNSSTILSLSALDDNNRVYFNAENVAENGIYIYRDGELGSYWTLVDSLNNQELGSTVYKLGYDSIASLPYVEFPSDIASLIGAGLHIKYIETTGENGNINANTLNKLSSTTSVDVITYSDDGSETKTITLSTDNLLINNASSTNNGCNPETIDEAYSNFKKSVGTFDTLVTCRDYMNAIYNMTDSTLNDLVSNCQVTDRRTDYNYANNILISNDTTTYVKSYTDDNTITPYDLCLYPLNPLTNSYTASTYNNSFTQLSSASLNLVESSLEDSKSISHTFKTLDKDDVYAFKNYYSLQANISTTYKVNTYEQNEILSNVYSALYKNFYSRKLEYGQEIPFDSILEVIKDSDTRIKNVSLLEPVLNTKVLKVDGTEVDFNTSDEEGIKYVIPYLAKNVISGKIALFQFDNRFTNTYGQVNSMVYENLISASTKVDISTSSEYTLRENEVIQLIAPSYVTDITYPAYVNYRYESITSSSTLTKDTIHKLSSSEKLKLNWTDSDGVVHDITYTNGDIIKPNKDIVVTTTGTITKNNEAYDQLGTEDEIAHLTQSSYNITSNSLPCYWILNSGRTLFDNTTRTRILQDNEYFFYSNSALTEMVTLGSGTKLTLDSNDTSAWTIPDDETLLNADDIFSNGISAFSGLNWKYKSGFNKIVVDEMQIITLTEGTKVTLHDSSISTLDNTFKFTSMNINPIITYTQDEVATSLPQIQVDNDSTWQIRSRLDLDASASKGQYVNDNQVITVKYKNNDTETSVTIPSGKYVKFNSTIQFSGSDNIDLRVTDIATGTVSNSVNCLTYTSTQVDDTTKGISKTSDSLTIDVSKIGDTKQVLIPLSVLNRDAINIIPVYLSHVISVNAATYTFEVVKSPTATTAIDNGMRLYNNGEYVSKVVTQIDANIQFAKMYNIEINGSVLTDTDSIYYLCIKSNQLFNDTITLKNLVTAIGINPILGLSQDSYKTQLLTKIKDLDVDSNFYYINSSTTIDVDTMLSPRALFDSDNVANNITISQIDTSSLSNITIARTSRL